MSNHGFDFEVEPAEDPTSMWGCLFGLVYLILAFAFLAGLCWILR